MRFIKIIIYILILNLCGCAGCSKSGRESLRNKSPREFNSANSRTSREQKDKKEISKETTPVIVPEITSNSTGILLSELYEKNRKGVFLVYSTNDGNSGSQGSGFFMSSNGIAVSNKHVFDDYRNHIIKLYDGTVLQVSHIIKESTEFDYVIFKVNTKGRQVYTLKTASNLPSIGEDVFAIGNPQGLEQTLSKGIVSSYRNENKYIQTTAEITNGSSGGPLFNMNGEVIGITTSGIGEANLNFAINIHLLDIENYL